MGFFALGVEVVALGRDALGVGHHPGDRVVDVDAVDVALVGEVAEVGQGAKPGAVDGFHQREQAVRVARRAAVVLADDVDVRLGGVLDEFAAAVGDAAGVLRAIVVAGVDPDGVAAQGGGGVDPLGVVGDGLRADLVVLGAEVPLAVDHDQDAGDALAGGPLLQLGEVAGVAGLVFEELVDELDAVDPVVAPRHLGEVEVVERAGAQGLVQRPLGQRDLVLADLARGGLAGGGVGGEGGPAAEGQGRPAGEGGAGEVAAVHRGRHRSGSGGGAVELGVVAEFSAAGGPGQPADRNRRRNIHASIHAIGF